MILKKVVYFLCEIYFICVNTLLKLLIVLFYNFFKVNLYNCIYIEKCDSNNDKWEVLNISLKVARSYHQSVAYGKLIIILGGWHSKTLDSIEIFNTESNQVSLIETRLNIPREKFACCKINSKIYIFGCTSNSSNRETVEVLDITDPYKPFINMYFRWPIKRYNKLCTVTACTF